MKKVICLALSILILACCFTVFADEISTEAKPTEINVVDTGAPQYILVVDSIGYNLPHPLYMENGRTMVEAEILAKLIGIKAEKEEDFIIFTDGKNVAKLSLTAPGAILNDGAVVLDAYAAVSEEIIYVPLRFVAESFGCTVDFSPVFTEENLFLGAYITVDTNLPSNVDFTLAVPDSLSELNLNIISITKTITGIAPEVTIIEADKYADYVNSALLAGQKIMFIKDEKTAKIDGHKESELLSEINSDSKDGAYSFPIAISGETLEFSVSAGVENASEALYFLTGMNELVNSLSASVE